MMLSVKAVLLRNGNIPALLPTPTDRLGCVNVPTWRACEGFGLACQFEGGGRGEERAVCDLCLINLAFSDGVIVRGTRSLQGEGGGE